MADSPLLARAAAGALWGVAASGLLTPRLAASSALAVLALGAAAGLAAALAAPRWEAWRRVGLAVLAGVCGALMNRVPEPTFFLLVPLVASAVAWPLAPPPERERPPPAWALPTLFLAAAALFFATSAQRHWGFASGRDLALFYQTQWLMAHGQPLFNTVIGMPPFADHLTLGDFLMAPLLRLADSAATLLLVQALAVASAVFPIAWLAARLLDRPRLGLGFAAAWALSPDVHMGVMWDFNPSPSASAALLWLAWALVARGAVMVVVLALLACAAKTNICMYAAVIALVFGARVVSWRRAAAVAGLAVAVLVLELAVVYPWFREGGFRHWKYEDLGRGPREIASAVLVRPQAAAGLLVDHPQKRRSLLLPLAATGYAGMADPLSLVLQLPNWGERFLSSHAVRWWGYYYGTPAAATALLGALLGARRLQAAGRAGPRLGLYVALCALLAGAVPPYRTPDGDRRTPVFAWHRPGALPAADVATQRAAVRFIGKDPRRKVAAQFHLLPHLAGRPHVYELDQAHLADVVALQLNGGTYPEGRPAWRRRVQDIAAGGMFHVAFCQGQTVVLFRGAGPSVPCPAWDALLARR